MTASVPSTVDRCVTLVDLLRLRAAEHDEIGYQYLQSGEREGAKLSYAALDRRARAIAARLQQSCEPGDRALLLYPQGLDFVAAFYGCLYAGVVAVPAYPPDPSRLQRTLPRLLGIAEDAAASVVLTSGKILPLAKGLFPVAPQLAELSWIATDSIDDDAGEDAWRSPSIDGDTLAFLQYTSGSTATPRGVMVSHGNLMHNQRMINRCFRIAEGSAVVSWLPLYHDMGLIGHVMQPLFVGGPCYLMSPIAFLKRPMRWLRAISRFRGTTSTAPNFGYDLCVRKSTPEERAELDLSCWRQALNGAEPIRHETLERFAETFGPCGFSREAFYPCYGLAEGTLVVSGAKRRPTPARLAVDGAELKAHRIRPVSADVDSRTSGRTEESRTLVSSGRVPLDDREHPMQRVVVVDPQTRRAVDPGVVGEIWISGSSVAKGYWRRQEATEQTFGAQLADRQSGERFLRTGDLGFIQDGELFVTGRLKDLIIVRGQNYYPQDIEWAVADAHPEIRPGSSGAFTLDIDGEELVAVVAEVDKRHRANGGPSPTLDVGAVTEAVRRAVAQQSGLHVDTIALVEAGSIPKTSSGKIQRRKCREALQRGSLELIAALDRTPRPRARAS